MQMRVAFVFPPIWTPYSDGSLQIWNHEVSTRLAKACDVTVYAGPFQPAEVQNLGNVHYRYFSTVWDDRMLRAYRCLRDLRRQRGPMFSSDVWYPTFAWNVARDIQRVKYDVVHVYYYPQFALLIKRLNPEARVVVHTMGEWLTQVPFTNLEERLAQLDGVISCGDFVTRRFRAAFPHLAGLCRTVPMGVSPEAFLPSAGSHRSERSGGWRLLYVGRLSPEKGVHVLLDAFVLLSQIFPDISLTVVGPEWVAPQEDITDLCLEQAVINDLMPFYRSGYLDQLRRRVTVSLKDRVTFAGLVPHGEIAPYYADADLYINPSLYESFGVSIIEAMAAAVPVVATDAGAVRDVVVDGFTGVLVRSASPSALVDGATRLLCDSGLRTSVVATAREAVLRQFSWETVCGRLLDVYETLLRGIHSGGVSVSAD